MVLLLVPVVLQRLRDQISSFITTTPRHCRRKQQSWLVLPVMTIMMFLSIMLIVTTILPVLPVRPTTRSSVTNNTVVFVVVFPWLATGTTGSTDTTVLKTLKQKTIWNNQWWIRYSPWSHIDDGSSLLLSSSSSSSSSFVNNNPGPMEFPVTTTTTTDNRHTGSNDRINNNNNNNNNNMHHYQYRSNTTHIVWYNTTTTTTTISWQTISDAKQEAYQYLRQNVMAFDVPFLQTMGFHNDDNNNSQNHSSQYANDGLMDGMIGPVIDIAFTTKVHFLYTDVVSKSIFYNYVLNYANVNENRNNIRPYLYQYLIQPLLLLSNSSSSTTTTIHQTTNYTMASVVRILDTHMWKVLAPHGHSDCIRFVSGQTPLIYDPMSVLLYGYGSCTGISILYIAALRTAGIPCRLAGTPAWNQNISHGNHNWVEIYIPTTITTTTSLPSSTSLSTISVSSISGVQFNTTTDDESILTTLQHLQTHDDNDIGHPMMRNLKINNNNIATGLWLFIEGSPNVTTGSVDGIDHWDPCIHFLCNPDRLWNQTQFFAATLSTDASIMTTTTHNNNNNSENQTTIPTYFPLAWDSDNHDVPAVNRTLYYHTICAQCK